MTTWGDRQKAVQGHQALAPSLWRYNSTGLRCYTNTCLFSFFIPLALQADSNTHTYTLTLSL